jgi:hypothetical protein
MLEKFPLGLGSTMRIFSRLPDWLGLTIVIETRCYSDSLDGEWKHQWNIDERREREKASQSKHSDVWSKWSRTMGGVAELVCVRTRATTVCLRGSSWPLFHFLLDHYRVSYIHLSSLLCFASPDVCVKIVSLLSLHFLYACSYPSVHDRNKAWCLYELVWLTPILLLPKKCVLNVLSAVCVCHMRVSLFFSFPFINYGSIVATEIIVVVCMWRSGTLYARRVSVAWERKVWRGGRDGEGRSVVWRETPDLCEVSMLAICVLHGRII